MYNLNYQHNCNNKNIKNIKKDYWYIIYNYVKITLSCLYEKLVKVIKFLRQTFL